MTEQALALCALVFQWADAYAARFGEPPCFRRMSTDIHAVIATLQAALATGEPLGEASPAARKRDRGSARIPSPMTPLECLHQHGRTCSSRNVWKYGDVWLGANAEQAARSLWLLLASQNRALVLTHDRLPVPPSVN